MEEKQIQEFVSRALNDENLLKELEQDPEKVIMREHYSPRVAQVLRLLVPHMTVDKPLGPSLSPWWTP